MSKILDAVNSEMLNMQPIHILKLDLTTCKFTVSATQGYNDTVNSIVIPKLKVSITFTETVINELVFNTATMTDGNLVTIFVLDTYASKKSIFAEDKPVRLEVYKSILSEILRLLIGNLTAVYNKTHSIDIGNEINRLIPVYTAYSK